NFTNIGDRVVGDFIVPSVLTDRRKYIGPFPLGTGGYGTVVGFERKNPDRTKDVAVKRLNTPFVTAKHAQSCFREIQLMRDLDHENIVKMKFAYTIDDSRDHLSTVYLVTEFAGLDLAKQLKDETLPDHKFTLRNFQSMICDLLRALKYLNSANVIHRDLKPGNLSISATGKLTLLERFLILNDSIHLSTVSSIHFAGALYPLPSLTCPSALSEHLRHGCYSHTQTHAQRIRRSEFFRNIFIYCFFRIRRRQP
ncbi:hypothetical protein PMAYCL1PPCAC_31435, partial [Pristionchus mayeri]